MDEQYIQQAKDWLASVPDEMLDAIYVGVVDLTSLAEDESYRRATVRQHVANITGVESE